MPFDAACGPIARTHLDLRAENGGHAPWCGPAAIALATGLAYAEACRLLHAVCPERYPEPDGVVAAWWRDLVEALRRHGLTRKKKSMHADEQKRPDVKRKRRSFRWRVRQIEPGRLKFVDESGANTAMTRAYAWAPRGERAVGSAPGQWKSFTVVAALGVRAYMTGPA